jgi:hypothetical protein
LNTAGSGADNRETRNFGLVLAGGFSVLGLLAIWRGRDFYIYLLAAAAVFALAGVFTPVLLRPVRRGWMAAAGVMGWFMTRAILALLFYAGFTPIGLLGRLFGKRFLEMEADASGETYWLPRERRPQREDYERQY